ncbi:hypothetical protein BN946_scf185001.g47 [Trametes cinnabarina]|uniref:Copper-fist domain-containing protein n=1 Tax=Pycnoporus cinnabarinus TaxID=5643 RepID=A0A060SRJ4_PYCCI|nr:hypothetical protein BN946_scf185001.g47 [Trametes cinnabarina]
MVYVNEKKFACESCIKGHRSSNCQHTDRPLFEIKKKGRPVSQCQKCRELRKTKRMHSRCTCAPAPASEVGPSSQALASSAVSSVDSSVAKLKTARRFKPIAPALPNGIKDLVPSTAWPSVPATANLCRCGGKDASVCTCGHDRAPRLSASVTGGLAALAQAAMFCCGGDLPQAPPAPAASPAVVQTAVNANEKAVVAEEDKSRKHPRSCCSKLPSSRPPSPQSKRFKVILHSDASISRSHLHDLPPLYSIPPLSQPEGSSDSMGAPPAFLPVPPISTIISYASPECCCGTDCACPGCLKHRGEAHVSKDFEDCTEGTCGICVDHEGGFEMPEGASVVSQGGFDAANKNALIAPSASKVSSPSSGSDTSQKSSASTSFIDAFFARAAALPPPPPPRTRAGTLDPTNVVVYPRDLFSGDVEQRKERAAAFGLVEVAYPLLR